MSGTGTPALPDGARSSDRPRVRERLLAAAEEIFGRRGFYGASIADMTRKAGIAQGSFYLHFPSKEAIFRELMRSRGDELRRILRDATMGSSPRAEIERAGFKAFFEWIADHPWFYRATRQAEFIDPELREQWYRSFADGYAEGLRSAMDRGAIPEADPEVLAWAMMGAADFTAMRWVVWHGNGEKMPGEKLDAFLDLAVRLLGAPSAH